MQDNLSRGPEVLVVETISFAQLRIALERSFIVLGILKNDATTSGKTTVGSMSVGSTTVDSIPLGTIRQLCQSDS